MLTAQDFLLQYEKYSDEELYNAYLTKQDYSTDAQASLIIAIDNRGGLESITDNLKQKHVKEKEIDRIKEEANKLAVPGIEISFLKSLIKSDILTQSETNKIIEDKYAEVQIEREDKKIKPRTIWGQCHWRWNCKHHRRNFMGSPDDTNA
jgi:hypothetical protein